MDLKRVPNTMWKNLIVSGRLFQSVGALLNAPRSLLEANQKLMEEAEDAKPTKASGVERPNIISGWCFGDINLMFHPVDVFFFQNCFDSYFFGKTKHQSDLLLSLHDESEIKFSGLNRSDERYLCLLFDANLLETLGLHGNLLLVCGLSFCWGIVMCHVVKCANLWWWHDGLSSWKGFVTGWIKDKFGGLNRSDERYLCLLFDTNLLETLGLDGNLLLVCGLSFCWGIVMCHVVKCANLWWWHDGVSSWKGFVTGWIKDKFSGLNESDERHLRLLSDANLLETLGLYGNLLLVCGSSFCWGIVMCHVVKCANVGWWHDGVSSWKGFVTGWIKDKFSGLNESDERHLRLLSDANLLETLGLHGNLLLVCGLSFCWGIVMCHVVKCANLWWWHDGVSSWKGFVTGWIKDKFSGLNESDERHLRLLSDANLLETLGLYGNLLLVCGSSFCWGIVMCHVVKCANVGWWHDGVSSWKGFVTGWIKDKFSGLNESDERHLRLLSDANLLETLGLHGNLLLVCGSSFCWGIVMCHVVKCANVGWWHDGVSSWKGFVTGWIKDKFSGLNESDERHLRLLSDANLLETLGLHGNLLLVCGLSFCWGTVSSHVVKCAKNWWWHDGVSSWTGFVTGWIKDKFSGLNESDERHLRLLSDANLLETLGLHGNLLLVVSSHVVKCANLWWWHDGVSSWKGFVTGWIKDKFSGLNESDERHLRLLSDANLLETLGLHGNLLLVCGLSFCWGIVMCHVVKCANLWWWHDGVSSWKGFVTGWIKDKFSGLNESDERHLRLLSDANLLETLGLYGNLLLVCGSSFCWGIVMCHVVKCANLWWWHDGVSSWKGFVTGWIKDKFSGLTESDERHLRLLSDANLLETLGLYGNFLLVCGSSFCWGIVMCHVVKCTNLWWWHDGVSSWKGFVTGWIKDKFSGLNESDERHLRLLSDANLLETLGLHGNLLLVCGLSFCWGIVMCHVVKCANLWWWHDGVSSWKGFVTGWIKDKFSGLTESDERHLRLLSDANLLETLGLHGLLLLVCGLSFCWGIVMCHVVKCANLWWWHDGVSSWKGFVTGWIKDNVSGLNESDERHLRLLSDANLLETLGLYGNLLLVCGSSFCWGIVMCHVVKCANVGWWHDGVSSWKGFVTGWIKDKFSGLNESDERHLRLLSDANLLETLGLHGLLLLVCGLSFCWGIVMCHVVKCNVQIFDGDMTVFLLGKGLLQDESKINSAGWMRVTRDISAYFLMQTCWKLLACMVTSC